MVEFQQARTAGGDGLAVGAQQADTEGCREAGAAVVGGAAADAEDDAAVAGVERGADDGANAVGGCIQRVSDAGRQESEAAGLGRLDDGGLRRRGRPSRAVTGSPRGPVAATVW